MELPLRSSDDYHTIQYDPSGNIVWQIGYNDKFDYGDRPLDIALDPAGNVVVAGQSMTAPNVWSYLTVRYVAHTLVMPVDSDSVSTSLRFLANRDQLLGTDGNPVERVRFYSNQCYPNVYMMDDTLSYVFAHIDDDTTTTDTMHRVDMSFVGGNAEAKLLPIQKEAYFNNYYLGHIPEGRPFVSLYKHLYMQDVWANVDVEYSSNQRGLKYYFIVHPGSEPSVIALAYNGQDALSVNGNDALVMETSVGDLVQPQALAYAMDGSGELTLLGWQPTYKLTAGVVTFDDIGSYDVGTDLVIEVIWGYVARITSGSPEWSTFYGGTQSDKCTGITTDASNNLYVTGSTYSNTFPQSGPLISPFAGGTDAFVGKFGSAYDRLWMTLYGGTSYDNGISLVTDPANNRLYVAGETSSGGEAVFARSVGVGSYVQSFSSGNTNSGFLAGFVRNTGQRIWSTQFGGVGSSCFDVGVDGVGNIYVTGNTLETNTTQTNLPVGSTFPICGSMGSYQQSVNNVAPGIFWGDGFIAKFSPQTALLWSTLYGGDHNDAFYALAIDEYLNMIYVVGGVASANLNTQTCAATSSYMSLCDAGGFFQGTINGTGLTNGGDGLIVRFDFDGQLDWASYFGGSAHDYISDVAVVYAPPALNSNPSAEVFIVGSTQSGTYGANGTVPQNGGFPHYAFGSQYTQNYGGNGDAFVAKFDMTTDIKWCSYYGGSEADAINTGHCAGPRITSDGLGYKYITGTTKSGSSNSSPLSFPISNNFYQQTSHGDDLSNVTRSDGYVLEFSIDDQMNFGTYFGGTNDDFSNAIALGGGRLYIGGEVRGTSNFPLFDPGGLSYFDGYPVADIEGFMAQIQLVNVVSAEPQKSLDKNVATLFPNPTQDITELEWESNSSTKYSLTICDLVGHVWVETTIHAVQGMNKISVPLQNCPKGLLILKLRSDVQSFSSKVIKL
jgi:hypothetical protein